MFLAQNRCFPLSPQNLPHAAFGNPAHVLYSGLAVCMSIRALSQTGGPDQYLPVAALFSKTTPNLNSQLPSRLAAPRVVQTWVSFPGFPKPLLAPSRNVPFSDGWDSSLWGNARSFLWARSWEAPSSFVWHRLIFLTAAVSFKKDWNPPWMREWKIPVVLPFSL